MHSAVRSLIAWVVLGASAPLAAPAAEIVDFEFTPTDVSADGSVVVGYREGSPTEAVRWTEAEGTTALGSFWIDPPDARCGGAGWGASVAWAVSGDGETAVGSAHLATASGGGVPW